jgi:class 3 adenylate cyclase/predicted ATPase
MGEKETYLRTWLSNNGISELASVLDAEDVDFEVLFELTEQDLRELGFSLGNRKKLLKAIENHSSLEKSPPATLNSGVVADAERRQLTVMFCDVVGSTQLSEQLDPEDLRDIMLAYQEACVEALQNFGGHIAKYLGDGILTYFGYPQAHEDDAERSVLGALELMRFIEKLNVNLEKRMGLRLGVRIGIHTGLVVAGEMGGGNVKEAEAIVGETPNIAARLEGLAEPGGIVIGPLTQSLIGESFLCRPLGKKSIRGISEPIEVYAVESENRATNSLTAAAARPEEPLVGRRTEITFLIDIWHRAAKGDGAMVILSGEAGIGKSRVTREIARRIETKFNSTIWIQGSSFHTATPLHPLIDLISSFAGFEEEELPEARLDKLENWLASLKAQMEDHFAIIGALLQLPVEERYGARNTGAQLQKRLTLGALLQIVKILAARHPLVIIVEDAHWLDPTTIEWLTLVQAELPAISVMVLVTARPEFEIPWMGAINVHELVIGHLDPAAAQELITVFTGGRSLPASITTQIIEKADGIPLFVEELTKSVLASEVIRQEGDSYMLFRDASLAIPATLQDLLTSKLDRLGPAKDTAQIGAALGRRFDHAMVKPLSSLDVAELVHTLKQLSDAELVTTQGMKLSGNSLFRHALIQDAAYNSMLKSRRFTLNGQIADLIEANHPHRLYTEPEVIARHRTAAGQYDLASEHWLAAAKQALARGANVEAIRHLERGLQCLSKLPNSDAIKRRELEHQCMLGPALMATCGWGAPEPHKAFNRARKLCLDVGDVKQSFAALWGIWLFNMAGGKIEIAQDLVEELFVIANNEQNEELELQAHHAAWGTRCWFGDMDVAYEHVTRGLEIYDDDRHRGHAMRYGGHDPGVCARVQGALTLWYRGYPDQAVVSAEQGLQAARKLDHPPSVAHALLWHCHVHYQRRDRIRAGKASAALAKISHKQALGQYILPASLFSTWAAVPNVGVEKTVVILRDALKKSEAANMETLAVFQKTILAALLQDCGQYQLAMREVEELLAKLDGKVPHIGVSDLYRLKGELCISLKNKDIENAHHNFRRSIEVARSQKARSFELRATTSYSRLLREEGRIDEAGQKLNSILDWFTEGFDTIDVINAMEIREVLINS